MKKIIFIIPLALSFGLTTAQPISFTQAPGSPIPNNQNQLGYASKDLNNDGFKDLIVGNAYSTSLYIYMGLGTGQFTVAPASPITTINGPIYTAVGLFNGDNIPDVAVANYNAGSISIFLGTGTGAFTPAPGSPIATGVQPYCIDVADFNMDGKKDLVVVNASSNTISLLLGNGLGSFNSAPGFPVSAGGVPYHVSAGFFNSDSFPDFAVANGSGNTVSVYLGNGTAVFTPAPGSPYTVGSQPRTISVKDVNNDNFPDLVVPNASSNNLSILLGSANGAFINASGSPITTNSYPYQSVVADLNLDGFQDIATTCSTNNNISFLYGSGIGTFTVAAGSPMTIGSGCHPIIGDDFNSDGKVDLALGDWYTGNVYVLINNTSPTCSLVASSLYTIGTSGTVNFLSASTGTNANSTFSWNFGDGTNANGLSTTHVYSITGIYTVTLTVNSYTPNCQNSSTFVINTCNLSPSFNYTIGTAGQVGFNSTSTGTTANTTFGWNFGDFFTSTGQATNHTYSAGGSFTVTLIASDGPGCTGTFTQVISIPSCSLVASFNQTVNTTGSASFTSTSTGTTANTTYSWNFGDGNLNVVGPVVSHNYLNPGTYTVTLTMNSSQGCSSTFSQVVIIDIKYVSIQELIAEKQITIAPNPTNGLIEIRETGFDQKQEFIIYNVLGQTVFKALLREQDNILKVESLIKGIYYYRISESGLVIKSGQIIIDR